MEDALFDAISFDTEPFMFENPLGFPSESESEVPMVVDQEDVPSSDSEDEGESSSSHGTFADAFMQRWIFWELSRAGFDSSAPGVAETFLTNLTTVLQSTITLSHDLAELGQRSKMNVIDVVDASERMGLATVADLQRDFEQLSKHRQLPFSVKEAKPLREPSIGPRLEEDEHKDISQSLLSLPKLAVPPSYSYSLTPVFPERDEDNKGKNLNSKTLTITAGEPNQQSISAAALAHLSNLRARQNNSEQVAKALRNLVKRTTEASIAVKKEKEAPVPDAPAPEEHALVIVNGAGQPGMEDQISADAVRDKFDDYMVNFEQEWYAPFVEASAERMATLEKSLLDARRVLARNSTTNKDILEEENENDIENDNENGEKKEAKTEEQSVVEFSREEIKYALNQIAPGVERYVKPGASLRYVRVMRLKAANVSLQAKKNQDEEEDEEDNEDESDSEDEKEYFNGWRLPPHTDGKVAIYTSKGGGTRSVKRRKWLI